MNWLQKISGRFESEIPPYLFGLASEARKHASPEEFEHAFLGQIKHGMYWHVTSDPNFTIDSQKGPTDMSSMSTTDSMDIGKLMITSHLMYWAYNYFTEGNPSREYAALIDMSDVDPKHYYQVNRGMGNEFFVSDPSSARVIGVYHLKDALRIDDKHQELLPQSQEELIEFYHAAHNRQPEQSGNEHFSTKTKEEQDYYDRLWQEEWVSEKTQKPILGVW